MADQKYTHDSGQVSYDSVRDVVLPHIRVALEAFDYAHLPAELQAVSKPFCDLAHLHAAAHGSIDAAACFHLDHGLERLLEAKDAFVRAALTR